MTQISEDGNKSSPEINTIEARVFVWFFLFFSSFFSFKAKFLNYTIKLPHYAHSKQILGDRFSKIISPSLNFCSQKLSN